MVGIRAHCRRSPQEGEERRLCFGLTLKGAQYVASVAASSSDARSHNTSDTTRGGLDLAGGRREDRNLHDRCERLTSFFFHYIALPSVEKVIQKHIVERTVGSIILVSRFVVREVLKLVLVFLSAAIVRVHAFRVFFAF